MNNFSYQNKIFFYFHEWKTYINYELKVSKKIKQWIVCSSVDASYLQQIGLYDSLVHVVPNCVDTKYFFPSHVKTQKNTIIFRGLMDKLVNIDAVLYFVNNIFPLILEKIPSVRFTIVGPKPVAAITKLHDGHNIFVTGFTNNMRKIMAHHEVVVCPVRVGSGTRHKILQAWAMRKPVVSTMCGAEGLLAQDKKNILLADEPQLFAKAVINLLENKNLRQFVAIQGWKTVQRYYDFHTIANQLEKVIHTSVRRNQNENNTRRYYTSKNFYFNG